MSTINEHDMTQEERIRQVVEEVGELLIRKNRDYGDSFAKQFSKYGIMSSLIRMDDKLARLGTQAAGQEYEVQDEGAEDTLRDLAGYAILSLVEVKKRK